MRSATDKDGYPTVCHHCGTPIVKNRHSSEHRYDHTTGITYSWHIECSPAHRQAHPER